MTPAEFIASFGLNNYVFLILASVGLAVVIIIDQAQLIAKFLGIRKKRIAGGYNNAMKIMVINRFGAVLYFLFIAISIDLGSRAEQISFYYVLVFIFVLISNAAISGFMMKRYDVSLSSLLQVKVKAAPIFMTLIATTFGLLGQTLPMLLSAENISIRLTMANTGFLFNAVFTILTVFFIENYLAEIIDDNHSDEKATAFVICVFGMRALGAAACVAVMMAMMQYSHLLKIDYWY